MAELPEGHHRGLLAAAARSAVAAVRKLVCHPGPAARGCLLDADHRPDALPRAGRSGNRSSLQPAIHLRQQVRADAPGGRRGLPAPGRKHRGPPRSGAHRGPCRPWWRSPRRRDSPRVRLRRTAHLGGTSRRTERSSSPWTTSSRTGPLFRTRSASPLKTKRANPEGRRLSSNPLEELMAVGYGMHPYRVAPDGTSYRWALQPRVEFFVADTVRHVAIPIRHDIGAFREPAQLTVLVDGRVAEQITLTDGTWRTLRYLPTTRDPTVLAHAPDHDRGSTHLGAVRDHPRIDRQSPAGIANRPGPDEIAGGGLREDVLRDHHALHFGGALVDLGRAHVSEQTLHD